MHLSSATSVHTSSSFTAFSVLFSVTFILFGLGFLTFFHLECWFLTHLKYKSRCSLSWFSRPVMYLASCSVFIVSVWACLYLKNTAVCLSGLLFQPRFSQWCKDYTHLSVCVCVCVSDQYLSFLSFFRNKQKKSQSSSLHGKHYSPKQLMWIFVIVKRTKRLWNSMQTIFFKLVYCTWISCRGECTY